MKIKTQLSLQVIIILAMSLLLSINTLVNADTETYLGHPVVTPERGKTSKHLPVEDRSEFDDDMVTYGDKEKSTASTTAVMRVKLGADKVSESKPIKGAKDPFDKQMNTVNKNVARNNVQVLDNEALDEIIIRPDIDMNKHTDKGKKEVSSGHKETTYKQETGNQIYIGNATPDANAANGVNPYASGSGYTSRNLGQTYNKSAMKLQTPSVPITGHIINR